MMNACPLPKRPPMSNPSFYCPISHERLLAVRGVDASKFLQGQLTCNLNYLDEQTSSLGARCTAKGRMLSSFRIVPQGDGYLLAMAAELLEAQMAELQKFARHGEAMAIRRADGCAELWISSTQAEEIRTLLAVKLTEAPLNDWLLGQIRAGIGQVFGPTRELFIPQMINLQALGGVSFKKGCYTGQEIVARMQYLGKLKRRLYRLSLPGSELPAIASEVFSPVHASAVGEVVLAATADGAVELLAVLQQDAVSDGRLSLQSAAGPQLTLLDLPYTLDSDREIQH